MSSLFLMIFCFVVWLIYAFMDGIHLQKSEFRWELRLIIYFMVVGLKGFSIVSSYTQYNTFELVVICLAIVASPVAVFPFINWLGSRRIDKNDLSLLLKTAFLFIGTVLIAFQFYLIIKNI